MKLKSTIFILVLLLLASPSWAQKKHKSSVPQASRLSGLYLSVDAGLLVPNSRQAQFYDGNPSTSRNSIDRVLHSELYGREIWSNLVDAQLISPSAIGDYRALRVEEYAPAMYYKLTYQLGVGFRYVSDNQWGWLLRFDYSQLTAAGQFNLSSDNGTGILGANRYVTCDVYGMEKRTLIDFGILKRVPLTDALDLEIAFGFDLNSTKVQKNGIRVCGKNYSILDVWGGTPPYPGIQPYEYLNEGRIGIGAFGSLALSYLCRVGSIDFGYQAYYMQTKFAQYNEADAYALQHNIFFRFNVNNFKFFD